MYGTLAGANDYFAARGNSEWAAAADDDKTAALQRATDYIDGRYRVLLATGRWASQFTGRRTDGRNQDNEWPRTGAVDYDGNAIDPDVVPDEVERATYEAASRELAEPGSLSPDYVASSQVTSEQVGSIKVTYAGAQSSSGTQDGGAPNRPVIPAIDEILAPLLRPPLVLPALMVV